MTRHLLDKDGDYCRFPHWNDTNTQQGNRLEPCGKPGYPYCEMHAEIVRLRLVTAGMNQPPPPSPVRIAGTPEPDPTDTRVRAASWNNHYLAGSR